MKYSQKDTERFWAKAQPQGDCLVWTSQLRGGYGLFRVSRKTVSAHRFAFMITHGYMPDTIIRHTCDNPPCVNPEHLLEGTRKLNMDDMYLRERNHGVKLSVVEEIRKKPMSRTIIKEVCKEYNISEQQVRQILNGSTFDKLPGGREIARQKTNSKLSIQDILEIKEAQKTPYHGIGNVLAERYGVTPTQISHIKHGRIHADVTDTEFNSSF